MHRRHCPFRHKHRSAVSTKLWQVHRKASDGYSRSLALPDGGCALEHSPGPDMALIIARSTQQGTRAGIVAALGVGVGAFIHIGAAAIGISALIVASAWAFTVLKWMGALYLTYLGIQ